MLSCQRCRKNAKLAVKFAASWFISLMLHIDVFDCRLVLTVTHSVASSLPLGSRNVRFLHVAFDVESEKFIAGDCQGNVFLFDLCANKYEYNINYGI